MVNVIEKQGWNPEVYINFFIHEFLLIKLADKTQLNEVQADAGTSLDMARHKHSENDKEIPYR